MQASSESPGETSKSAVIDAARALKRRGDKITVASVARQAGISRAALYKLYPSRAALHRGLAEAGLQAIGVRERLLDACSAVLRELRPSELTLAQVAEAANVGEATLYRQFGDRDGLLRAWAAERSPRRLAAELDSLSGENLAEDVARILAHGIEFLRTYPGMLELMRDSSNEPLWSVPGGPGTSREALLKYLKRQRRAGRLPGVDVNRLLSVLLGSVIGFALHPPDDGTPEEHARYVVGLVLSGPTPETPTAARAL